MSTWNLQSICDAAAGDRIDLDPQDTFVLDTPSLKIRGQVELYGHGATITHDRAWKQKSAPLVSGPDVTGIIDGLTLVGSKDPAQKYVAAREGHAGFWFMGAEDLTLSHCTVSHVAGDFAYFGARVGGTKKQNNLWEKPCRGVVMDHFVGIDAGRHRIAACGVGKDGGLRIAASCAFYGWQRLKTDREAMNRYRTPKSAVWDASTSVKKP